MRLKMCEYTATPEKGQGPTVHGVCHRSRLQFMIEDGSITAKMIEDEAAAILQRKWEGDIEPKPKKKSPPDVQVPVHPSQQGAPFITSVATPGPSQMVPSMPPSGIKK